MSKRRARESVIATRPLWAADSYGLWGAVLIVVLVFVGYAPALHGGFLLDDNILLTENALIAASDGLYRFWFTREPLDYWPVSNSMLWLEWRVWGMRSTGYHATNLVLHIAEVLLLWRLLWQLAIPGAFLAALLFAVHPVNVETVAWIAQRKSLLAMLFCLLSVLAYLGTEAALPRARRAPSKTNLKYGLSLLCFTLAMLSKVSAAILPLLLLGIVWWLRPLTQRDLLRSLPFFAIALVLLCVNLWFRAHGLEDASSTATPVERALGAAAALWFYLSKALLPIDLIFIYPEWQVQADQWRWWFSLLAAAAVTCVLWWYRHGWGRAPLFAWGFFCIALLPVLGFADIGRKQHLLVADHYQHMALIAVTALAAAAWRVWHKRAPSPWVANAVATGLVGVLTLLTWRQSGAYIDAATLYRTTLEKNPKSWLAHNNLGITLAQSGRFAEAVVHYEQALALNPDYAATLNSLGISLAASGRLREAIERYEHAVRVEPAYADAYNNLGIALTRANRLAEAITQLEISLRLRPGEAQTHYNLGNTLMTAQRPTDAIEHYKEAVRLQPSYSAARYNLATTLAKSNRAADAIDAFQQLLQLTPDDIQAWGNLAMAHASMQQPTEAVKAAERAIELARAKGQTAMIEPLENWLTSYRGGTH